LNVLCKKYYAGDLKKLIFPSFPCLFPTNFSKAKQKLKLISRKREREKTKLKELKFDYYLAFE